MGNAEKKTQKKNRRLQLSRSFSEKVQKYFIPTQRDCGTIFENPTVQSLILLRAPDLETFKTLLKGTFLVIQTYPINKVCVRPWAKRVCVEQQHFCVFKVQSSTVARLIISYVQVTRDSYANLIIEYSSKMISYISQFPLRFYNQPWKWLIVQPPSK